MKIKKGDRVYPNPNNSFKSNDDWGWPCEVINTFTDILGNNVVQFSHKDMDYTGALQLSSWVEAMLTTNPPAVEVEVVEFLGACKAHTSKARDSNKQVYEYIDGKWLEYGVISDCAWHVWCNGWNTGRLHLVGKMKIKLSPKGYV